MRVNGSDMTYTVLPALDLVNSAKRTSLVHEHLEAHFGAGRLDPDCFGGSRAVEVLDGVYRRLWSGRLEARCPGSFVFLGTQLAPPPKLEVRTDFIPAPLKTINRSSDARPEAGFLRPMTGEPLPLDASVLRLTPYGGDGGLLRTVNAVQRSSHSSGDQYYEGTFQAILADPGFNPLERKGQLPLEEGDTLTAIVLWPHPRTGRYQCERYGFRVSRDGTEIKYAWVKHSDWQQCMLTHPPEFERELSWIDSRRADAS